LYHSIRLAHRVLEADGEELLRFDGELHRELAEDVLARS
jgi:hypothetical protein